MRFDPKIHHRRSIRLQRYDYSQVGAYFVTIVAWQREILFGDIVNGEMKLNEFGEIVSHCCETPKDRLSGSGIITNTSSATNPKWTGLPVTSNPIHCGGRVMMKIRIAVRNT